MRNRAVVTAMPAAALAAALAVLVAAGCASRFGRSAPAPAAEEVEAGPGRVHRLVSWGLKAPPLLINVPEAYDTGRRDEQGLEVFLFRRPPKVAPPESASLGIYIGRRPRAIRDKAIADPGTVAGRPVTWYGSTWQDGGRTVYHGETQIAGLFDTGGTWDPNVRKLIVHLFAWGTDQAQVEALIEACKSLRIDTER